MWKNVKKDGGYPLPDVIDPPRRCIKLYVPDNDIHMRAFWGALHELTRWFNWEFDDNHTAKKVADVWFDVWLQNHNNWEDSCMDDPCCPEEITNLQEISKNIQEIVSLLKGGITGTFMFNPSVVAPDESGGDCAPNFFDHDTPDDTPEQLAQREKALCITLERYVKSVFLNVLVDMSAPASLIDFIHTMFPATVPLPLLNPTIVYPDIFSGLAAFFDALGLSTDLTPIVCAMKDGLSGDKNNTFMNFKNSLNSFTPDPSIDQFTKIIAASNGVKSNYKAFNSALNDAFSEDLEGYECPCVEPPADCTTPLELMIVPSADTAGSTFTALGGDLYRFVQNTLAPGGKYITAIRDTHGRCLLVEPQGEDTQDPFAWAIQDCDGEWHTGISSFAPVETMEFSWQNTDPMDTIYKVTCVS